MKEQFKFQKQKNRIAILAWHPAGYDHDEGYYEIAHIKLSTSSKSIMCDWNLDELMSVLSLEEAE
ncbi:hypothetical protein [Enterococcus mundtii]|uniref:hypothetical protein n=1 Tax=Enterococcus mundtii TaxID=53346 RepID=UPI0032DEF314